MIKLIRIEDLDWREKSAVIEVIVGCKRKPVFLEVSFYELCHYKGCPIYNKCLELCETDQAICIRLSKSPEVKEFLDKHHIGYGYSVPVPIQKYNPPPK